jgi:GNAT superfamily N-acetyltransferase
MIHEARKEDEARYIHVKPNFGIDDVRARFEWNTQNNVDWYIYESAGEVCGWVNLNWSAKDPACPDIFDLYVKPNRRGRGIGTALIHFCEGEAHKRGHEHIGLAVNPDLNAQAMRLYEGLGYIKASEPYLDGVYNGVEDWSIDMKKTIQQVHAPDSLPRAGDA